MQKYSIFVLLLIIVPLVAFAQSDPSAISLKNPLTSESFDELIQAVIDWLLIVTLPVVTLLIVYAAFQIMVAGPNPKQREDATNIIKYALLGYGIIIMSRAIVAVIQALFG